MTTHHHVEPPRIVAVAPEIDSERQNPPLPIVQGKLYKQKRRFRRSKKGQIELRVGKAERLAELRRLLAYDPRCVACGRKLTDEKGQPNYAHVVNHFLACPVHEKVVRHFGRHGRSEAMVVLTAKGHEYLESHRPTFKPFWIVDGVEYDWYPKAERAAVELARLLGVKMYVYEGNESRRGMKISQIVRPGDDANCGDASFHRGRSRLTEFSRTKVGTR